MIEWRIYYGDGSTFDSSQGPPEAAPPHNVIAVMQKNELTGRDVFNSWDWYLFKDGIGWWGYDLHGVLDQVMNDPDRKIHGLIQGRTIPNEDFKWIIERARNDSDLPRKSADRKGETFGQQYGPGKSE